MYPLGGCSSVRRSYWTRFWHSKVWDYGNAAVYKIFLDCSKQTRKIKLVENPKWSFKEKWGTYIIEEKSTPQQGKFG